MAMSEGLASVGGMADFHQQDLADSRFEQVHLQRATFHEVHLNEADFNDVDLTGARFREAWFKDVVMRGVGFVNVEISGEIESLTVNGVDVAPLVQAELDRREPDLVKMRPTDPDGFREAWDILERLWADTVERARALPAAALHESVDDEWSFIETLRHLAFATECWLYRAILGDPSPWDPLSLPWDGMPDTEGVPRDRDARPSLDEALALRLDRQAAVRRYIDKLDEATLASDTVPVEGPGWPKPRAYPVRECLLTLLNEEWWHRQFALRDLALLEQRAG
jgi:DinB superfamily/Pentapeptide repeats (9 copies)